MIFGGNSSKQDGGLNKEKSENGAYKRKWFMSAPMQLKNEDIYVPKGHIGNKYISMPRFLKNAGRLRIEILYMPRRA